MPIDEPEEVKPLTMLTFTDAAKRLVEEQVVRSMTGEGLRKIARTDPEWPLSDADYGRVAGVRLVPYETLVEFMQTRSKRRGRGPDLKPRKKSAAPPEGEAQPPVE
jgi:hypothetical protein